MTARAEAPTVGRESRQGPRVDAKNLIVFSPKIEKYIPYLQPAWDKWGITMWLDQVHWLAQTAHESARYVYSKEIWGPTAQQQRYERDFTKPFTAKDPRNSLAYMLGNSKAGDGKKYQGYGLIQTTGRSNILRTSMALFGDDRLLRTPEILSQPEYAVESAAYYWNWRKITPLALEDDLEAVTKKVNGGLTGIEDREKLLKRAKTIL